MIGYSSACLGYCLLGDTGVTFGRTGDADVLTTGATGVGAGAGFGITFTGDGDC